jgi:hypothetical protein
MLVEKPAWASPLAHEVADVRELIRRAKCMLPAHTALLRLHSTATSTRSSTRLNIHQ